MNFKRQKGQDVAPEGSQPTVPKAMLWKVLKPPQSQEKKKNETSLVPSLQSLGEANHIGSKRQDRRPRNSSIATVIRAGRREQMEQVQNKEHKNYLLTHYWSVSTQNTEIHTGTEFMYIHTTELSLEIAPKIIFWGKKRKQADESPRLLRRLLEANI